MLEIFNNKRSLPTSDKGETIVEVLMSIAVIGLVLGSTFLIARGSLRDGQQAAERTQAVKIVESQVEKLKAVVATPGNGPGQGVFSSRVPFCLADAIGGGITKSTSLPNIDCDQRGFPESNLIVSIVYDEDGPNGSANTFDDDTFMIKAEWDGLDGLRENVTIYYRIHPIE